jgi:hypothetical protein
MQDLEYVSIIPATQEIVDRLVAPAARADGSAVFNATQVVIKNKEVVGYLSIGAVPTTLCWLHKTKMQVRDSLAVNSFIENYVRNVCNSNIVIFPCHKSSPLYEYMTRVGYVASPEDVMFYKDLTKTI